jgi:hypothetical protein
MGIFALKYLPNAMQKCKNYECSSRDLVDNDEDEFCIGDNNDLVLFRTEPEKLQVILISTGSASVQLWSSGCLPQRNSYA